MRLQNTNNTTILQKVGLIGLGLFLCAVILEAGCRLAGGIIISWQEHQNKKRILGESGEFRILCLGGSIVASGGSNSFPSQLEEVLNRKETGKRFAVINNGICNADSSFIVAHLKENLDRYQPHMVVVMMGENDNRGDIVPYDDSLSFKLKQFVKNIRVHKLIKLLKLHVMNKMQELKEGTPGHGVALATDTNNRVISKRAGIDDTETVSLQDLFDQFLVYREEQWQEAEPLIKKIVEIENTNEAKAQLADFYTLMLRFKDAEELLNEVVVSSPQDAFVLTTLGRCYSRQGRYNEAEAVLNKAIEADPFYRVSYSELMTCYRLQGEQHKFKKILSRLEGTSNKSDALYGMEATISLEMGDYAGAGRYYRKADELRERYYNEVTRYNYNKLKEIVLERGIKLVCVQHATRSVGPLKKLLGYSDGIIFVDNERLFKEALKRDRYEYYFEDNFAGDFGHCTIEGNKLLAGNVARTIVNEYFNEEGL
ncbi:MAG: tetratricopeptide repeat protein [Candidatus Omnitrophota bacterium]